VHSVTRHRAAGRYIATGAAALTLAWTAPATGQVVFDGSLGPPGPAPAGAPGSGIDFLIPQDRGQLRGTNLFQSFSEFSIPTGLRAEFTAADPVDVVVARVTGGVPSRIDGTLASSISGADVYFLNPSGVFFSETAVLDVPASFHVATADSLRFADGAQFVVDDPGPPVLSASPPAAFGFLPGDASEVTFDKPLPVAVAPGETLTAIGGKVSVLRTGTLSAPGGSIQLAAVGSAGVEVPVDVADFAPAGGELGEIQIDHVAVDTLDLTHPDAPQGRIVIRGGSLAIDRSFLFAGGQGVADGRAIDVEVSGTVGVGDGSNVFAFGAGSSPVGGLHLTASDAQIGDLSVVGVQSSGSGPAGSVELAVDRLEIRDGSQLVSEALGDGTGGDLQVAAKDSVSVLSASEIATRSANGPGGALTVVSGDLTAEGGSQISTTTNGSGFAGSLTVHASGDLTLSGVNPVSGSPSGIFARSGSGVGSPATGDGGDIDVTAANLAVTEGAVISTRTFGSGAAGGLTLAVDGTARISDSGFVSSGAFIGDGGPIALNAGSVQVVDGGQIFAATSGTGRSGDIRVDAGSLQVSGTSALGAPAAITAETTLPATAGDGGDAGVIEMSAGDVTIAQGGLVSTRSEGTGAANRISIQAQNSLLLDGAQVRSLAQSPTASAPGGAIALHSGRDATLHNGAVVNAQSLGQGDAGSISIDAARHLDLSDAFVTTEAASALGGNIALEGGERLTLTRSEVTTSVQQGVGSGGNIDLGNLRVSVNDSSVLARAFAGNGGDIRIFAPDAYLQSADSLVDASSTLGVSGRILVTSPDTDIAGELARLPESFLDASQLLRRECAARTRRAGSFVVEGAPLPPPPDGPLGQRPDREPGACPAQ